MPIFIGIIIGFGLPIQTSINNKLREKVNSPYIASFISFLVAFIFLFALLFLLEDDISYPMEKLLQEPFWIWLGGLCGVVFLTGNIIVFSHLGSIETAVLPVLGQILMGLFIDSFGLFRSLEIPLNPIRAIGALLVFAGVMIIALAKGKGKKELKKDNIIWLWRLLGIAIGMLLAIQVAINGHFGRVASSPVKASIMSFLTGIGILLVIILIIRERNGKFTFERDISKYPWWIWLGGILGGTYNLANVYLSRIIGTGMTVIALLVGTTICGLLVDQFGFLGARKNPVNLMKIMGVILMIAGSSAIRLF